MRYLILLTVLLAATAFHSDNPDIALKELVKNDIPYLVEFYKERHKNPEISLREEKTAAALAGELRKAGYDVTENFGGYGIVGILKNGNGPTILYRTDMDALPMYEKTELAYSSQLTTEWNGSNVGTMHSCGHDIHMTTLLGTARAMAEMKKEWKGTLMLIGQPAEEIGAGARMMLDAGLYEKFGVPNYGVGLHSSPTIEAGKIGLAKGPTMAAVDNIDIKIFGVGAHGASPHMSIDPVVTASMIVMELQTIVSRNLKPIESAVVTVGAIKGGTKHNIIPDEVTLQLTIRTYKQEVRALVHRRIKEISRGVAIAAGVPEDLMPVVTIPEDGTPSNINDDNLVDKVTASASTVIGKDNVLYAEPQMVGEDFARYGRTVHKVPTALFWLGTVSKEKIEKGNLPGLHSPFYYPEPAKSVETGVTVMSQTLIDLFNQKM